MQLAGKGYTKLTLEDILNRHRYWISSLYLEDGKSATEIVEVLHENCFQVTLSQIQTAIEPWKLIPENFPEHQISDVNRNSIMSAPTSKSASTRSAMSCSSNTSYPPSDPDIAILYTFKPLPPLPTMKHRKLKLQTSSSTASETDSPTCYHGSLPLNAYEIKPRLDSIPIAGNETRTSILEMYMNVQQSHEMIAVGLPSGVRSPAGRQGRGELRQERSSSRPRVRKSMRTKKRRTVPAREEDPNDTHSDGV